MTVFSCPTHSSLVSVEAVSLELCHCSVSFSFDQEGLILKDLKCNIKVEGKWKWTTDTQIEIP
jgi:hypothetical protein